MDENNATTNAVTETEPAADAVVSGTPETEIPGYDEDTILPDNWKPQDGGEPENPDKPFPEDQNLYQLFGLNPDGTEKDAENPETPESAEPKPESSEPPKQGTEPDYKAMYEQLLRSTQDAKGRDTFRQVYAEQKAAGMSDAAARLVARDAAGGKEFPLTDDDAVTADGGKPDYAAALNQLHSVAPELKEIPPEVTRAIMDGGDAVTAYMGYQRTQDQKTIGELRSKVAELEQKAANTVHAVARGVSGNGAKQAPEYDFIKGMMAEDW